MRVLMFGRGTIATLYGHALQAAGHDVEFYVRPGRAAQYGETVTLDLVDGRRSPLRGPVRRVVPLRFRESLTPADGFDLVALSVGHHRLAEAARFLAPRIGDATVLVFGNIWDEPLAAVSPLPEEQVVFGFPQGGGGFGEDGVLHGALLRAVILGSAGPSAIAPGPGSRSASAGPVARRRAVGELFRQAGFAVREEADLRGWLWLHFAADVGMHAQGLVRGGLARLIGDRRSLREALLTSRELLPVVAARGVDLTRHRRATIPFRLPGAAAAGMAWASAHLPIARMSLAAHTDPHDAEARAVLDDAAAEARRRGIPTPRLDAVLAGAVRP